MSSTTSSPLPLRPLQFTLLSDVATWHGNDPDVSLFFNVLSTFFPEGETFFIKSVQDYRDVIEDPVLGEQVRRFCGQEGSHRREHTKYNARLAEAGYPVPRLERQLKTRLTLLRRCLPARHRLAVTCALEHFTAVLADALLSDPRTLAGAAPDFAAIWTWHALEEIEHKAVCFDVYQAMGGHWPERTFYMVLTTLGFLAGIVYHMHVFQKVEGRSWRMKPWQRTLRWLLHRPGADHRSLRLYLNYFRPDFHPWEGDGPKDLAAFYRAHPKLTVPTANGA